MLHLFGSEFTNATRAATRSFSLISLSGRFGNPASVVILTRSAGCCAGSFWCVPQPASRRGSTRAKPILLILPGGQSWDGPEDGAPSDRPGARIRPIGPPRAHFSRRGSRGASLPPHGRSVGAAPVLLLKRLSGKRITGGRSGGSLLFLGQHLFPPPRSAPSPWGPCLWAIVRSIRLSGTSHIRATP